MPTKEEIVKRIIAAIQEKIGDREITCSVCGEHSWIVGYHYIVLTGSDEPNSLRTGEEALPLIPVGCKKCGNTLFMNLLGLGFTAEDLESMGFSKEEKIKSAKPEEQDIKSGKSGKEDV